MCMCRVMPSGRLKHTWNARSLGLYEAAVMTTPSVSLSHSRLMRLMSACWISSFRSGKA